MLAHALPMPGEPGGQTLAIHGRERSQRRILLLGFVLQSLACLLRHLRFLEQFSYQALDQIDALFDLHVFRFGLHVRIALGLAGFTVCLVSSPILVAGFGSGFLGALVDLPLHLLVGSPGALEVGLAHLSFPLVDR